MQRLLERCPATFIVLQATACILQLSDDLLFRVRNTFKVQFQILHVLDQIKILRMQTCLDRCDVDDGAIQFFDFHTEFGDLDFQFLNVFDGDVSLFRDRLNLRKKFVDFSLEFALFLLGSAMEEKRYFCFNFSSDENE